MPESFVMLHLTPFVSTDVLFARLAQILCSLPVQVHLFNLQPSRKQYVAYTDEDSYARLNRIDYSR